ncbi:DUF2637 domain-containing protein [Kitasatospora sp. NPDC056138]|uniref:DUF2637 domain-containing protein n=1 Tax=Kitasatospora sp. NPDC056138 TaxID=3345724 RepID=UPI0035D59B56
MTTPAATTATVTGWDRAVVITLGGAGCALSYDALQQMAVAIHVRGFLTYLFPLVIDGFIAYGVRALLVLRNAPLRARAYVWLLFGTATTASIWANALHAVRLNQQRSVTGLRLGDTVVAVLSTLAPLALAGAVHLYILIARGATGDSDRSNPGQPDHVGQGGRAKPTEGTQTARAGQPPRGGQAGTGQPDTTLAGAPGQGTQRPRLSRDKPLRANAKAAGNSSAADSANSDSAVIGHKDQAPKGPDLGGQPDTRSADNAQPTGNRSDTGRPDSNRATGATAGRRNDLNTEELLEIARTAVKTKDKKPTRKVVAQAIRGQDIPLSNDRLTDLVVQLRAEFRQPPETFLG